MTQPMAECFPSVRAEVARLTRLDGCGRPLPGPCSTIITDDIVSITGTPEVEEGETVRITNMAGRICINDKPCQEVPEYDVEITMCKIMPVLFNLVAGYDTYADDDGNVVGFDIGQSIDCSGGFALEIWGNVPGTECAPGAAGTGQWNYIVFPYISAAALTGAIEIQNDAYQPVLAGSTKLGHGWGVGPYDVVLDGTGAPAPLASPIPSSKHARITKTNLAPPEPVCRCYGLSGPDAPTVAVTKDAGDPTGFTVDVSITTAPPAGGAWEVCWDLYTGDPAVQTCEDVTGGPLPAPFEASNDYTTAGPGTYQITVRDKNDPGDASTTYYTLVTVPMP